MSSFEEARPVTEHQVRSDLLEAMNVATDQLRAATNIGSIVGIREAAEALFAVADTLDRYER